jgi:GntR family transcriptional regulator/MocR family aminotransferase
MYLDGHGPLFQQVYRAIRDAIVSGRFTSGARLPPTRLLADDLGVSRATVLLAYEQLAAEGYVGGRRGSGTYVQGAAATPAAAPRRREAGGSRPRLGRLAAALVAHRRPPLESGYAPTRPALRWDFRYGLPSLEEFPLETWQRCVGRAARHAPARAYDYGPPQGSPALRAALAEYLGRSRNVLCAPEQLVVVTGSQQGIDLAARLLLDPGARAVVEEPGFEGARNAFLACGATLAPVAVDAEGLDPAALPDAARLALVTPSHQYPLGGTLSWTRRAALLGWAARTGAWVIEDDYDGEYRFDGRPVPPLKALDADDRVLYLGTFSKVMFPALRLGYLVLPPTLVEAFARAKLLADGGSPRLEQEALAEFVASGAFARHVRRSRARNGERRAALLGAIGDFLGDRVAVCGANAGLHAVLWVRGVPGRSAGALARRAAEAGVGIYPVTPYYLTPPGRAGFILGYGALRTADIRAGIARLARVLDEAPREEMRRGRRRDQAAGSRAGDAA